MSMSKIKEPGTLCSIISTFFFFPDLEYRQVLKKRPTVKFSEIRYVNTHLIHTQKIQIHRRFKPTILSTYT